MILYSEGATKSQEAEADAILDALNTAYPGHPWWVHVYEGGFAIKHLDFDGNWGMRAKFSQFGYSASALKREVIMKAGEWLERAYLKRGPAVEGQEIVRVDGVPEKKKVEMDVVVDASKYEPLRTEARPQALKEE